MSGIEKRFFMDIDLESSDGVVDTSIQEIFQERAHVRSRDNEHYIEKLEEELKAVGALEEAFRK